jgi:uncharacterized RDD family membrane protein YckC
MNKTIRPSIIKRILALIIDFIILGIIGAISGLFFENFYASIGIYGTLIGSSITILYFSILQSSTGKGQSLGKKAIGVKVTDLNGNYLSNESSFLRSFILYFPIMNIEILSNGNKMIIVLLILTTIILASIYFILINKSRRSLHDILTKSIVINKDIETFEIDEENDRSNKKLIPIIIISVILICTGIYQSFGDTKLNELLVTKEKIENLHGVISVSKAESSTSTTTFSDENKSPVTYSAISIVVRIDNEEEANNFESEYFEKFYEIVKNNIPDYNKVDAVNITLYYGYNIGISSKSQSITNTFEN